MLKEIPYSEIPFNPITAFDNDWMALTAGTKETGFNTMTVSWGHLGTAWDSARGAVHSAICYVRPQRYTKQFIDREDYFTLSWFGKEHHEALVLLGTKSGRDCDKVGMSGLTPVFDCGAAYFAEAKLVLVCRKIYRAPVTEEGFVDKDVLEHTYPKRDFHDLYVGEIVKVLVRE